MNRSSGRKGSRSVSFPKASLDPDESGTRHAVRYRASSVFHSEKVLHVGQRLDVSIAKHWFLQQYGDAAAMRSAPPGNGKTVSGVLRHIEELEGGVYRLGIETDGPIRDDNRYAPLLDPGRGAAVFEHEPRCVVWALVKEDVTDGKTVTRAAKKAPLADEPQYCASADAGRAPQLRRAKFVCDFSGHVGRAPEMWRMGSCGYVIWRARAAELLAQATRSGRGTVDCFCSASGKLHTLTAAELRECAEGDGGGGGGSGGEHSAVQPVADGSGRDNDDPRGEGKGQPADLQTKQIQYPPHVRPGDLVPIQGWVVTDECASRGLNPCFVAPSNVQVGQILDVVWPTGGERAAIMMRDSSMQGQAKAVLATPAEAGESEQVGHEISFDGDGDMAQVADQGGAPGDLYTVQLDEAALGLRLEGSAPATVLSVTPGGCASRANPPVHPHSSILYINDEYVAEWTHEACGAEIAKSGRPLQLTLAYGSPPAPRPPVQAERKEERQRSDGGDASSGHSSISTSSESKRESVPMPTSTNAATASRAGLVVRSVLEHSVDAAAAAGGHVADRRPQGDQSSEEPGSVVDGSAAATAPANLGQVEALPSFAEALGHKGGDAAYAEASSLSHALGYHRWRHVRGDGNCYYRAVALQLLEHVMHPSNLGTDLEHLLVLFRGIDYMRDIEAELEQAARQDNEMHAQLVARLESVRAGDGWDGVGAAAAAEAAFQPARLQGSVSGALTTPMAEAISQSMLRDGVTDLAMVRALRRLTADYLLEHKHHPTDHSDGTSSTVGGGVAGGETSPTFEEVVVAQAQGADMEQFCLEVVLRMGIEAEGVVLQALPSALHLVTRIVVLDTKAGSAGAQVVDFPESNPAKSAASAPSLAPQPPIHMVLYRGHYDILYPGIAGEQLPNWGAIQQTWSSRPRAGSGSGDGARKDGSIGHNSASTHALPPLEDVQGVLHVQAPPDKRVGEAMRWVCVVSGTRYSVRIPAEVAANDLFPIVAEHSEQELLRRAMEASALEAEVANPRIGGGVKAAAARARRPPPKPAVAALRCKAGDRVMAYHPLAERMAEGEVAVVLADRGEVRISFDLRDSPPTFYSIIEALDTRHSTGSFWQGDPEMLTSATLEVRWKSKSRTTWYKGLVTGYDAHSIDPKIDQLPKNRAALSRVMGEAGLRGMHHIAYEDDTSGHHNLACKTFRVLASDHSFPLQGGAFELLQTRKQSISTRVSRGVI